jgi:ATP-dependent HslUV protease ATP-binding subunit HslU
MGLNERLENIGARRLQTVMTTLLEEVMFDLPETSPGSLLVDRGFVRERLKKVADDEDLSRFIL